MQLIVRHGHAVGATRTGQANQMLRADVRGENRRAHKEPPQVPSGKEIVIRRVFALSNHPSRNPQEQSEVQPNDNPIKPFHIVAPFP